jgi:hypothetical protein
MNIFSRFFFPKKQSHTYHNNVDLEGSDSDENEELHQDTFRRGGSTLDSVENSSTLSFSKNRELTNKLKLVEQTLKEKVSNNWVSVRKAFLDIDEDYDGYLTSEDLSKLIGGSNGSTTNNDYNMIKMLINIRNKN